MTSRGRALIALLLLVLALPDATLAQQPPTEAHPPTTQQQPGTQPPEAQPPGAQPPGAQPPATGLPPGAPPLTGEGVQLMPLTTIEAEDNPAWTRTLERIATGVVAIQVDGTRAFDTEWNTSAQATGFVVDAKRGLVLTNRHVVTPGPVTA